MGILVIFNCDDVFPLSSVPFPCLPPFFLSLLPSLHPAVFIKCVYGICVCALRVHVCHSTDMKVRGLPLMSSPPSSLSKTGSLLHHFLLHAPGRPVDRVILLTPQTSSTREHQHSRHGLLHLACVCVLGIPTHILKFTHEMHYGWSPLSSSLSSFALFPSCFTSLLLHSCLIIAVFCVEFSHVLLYVHSYRGYKNNWSEV